MQWPWKRQRRLPEAVNREIKILQETIRLLSLNDVLLHDWFTDVFDCSQMQQAEKPGYCKNFGNGCGECMAAFAYAVAERMVDFAFEGTDPAMFLNAFSVDDDGAGRINSQEYQTK